MMALALLAACALVVTDSMYRGPVVPPITDAMYRGTSGPEINFWPISGPLLAPCVLHFCSNDTLGVFGDEALRWDAASNMSAGAVYEVHDARGACLIVAGDLTSVRVAGSACLVGMATDTGSLRLRVRACNPDGFALGEWICGGFSASVEFVVPGCLEHRSTCWLYQDGRTDCPSCTRACYADQPLPLPLSQRYEVCP